MDKEKGGPTLDHPRHQLLRVAADVKKLDPAVAGRADPVGKHAMSGDPDAMAMGDECEGQSEEWLPRSVRTGNRMSALPVLSGQSTAEPSHLDVAWRKRIRLRRGQLSARKR